jgi:hypothetical protein
LFALISPRLAIVVVIRCLLRCRASGAPGPDLPV